MKKVLAVIALVLILASASFAIVGTDTKLQAQANLPSTMTDDNVMIGQYIVSELDNFGNLAALEATPGQAFAYTLMKSSMGTFGLSFSPSYGTKSGLACALPANMIGLQWANKGVGAGILFGTDLGGFEYKDPLTATVPVDKSATNRMFIGLQGGTSINVGMPLDIGLNLNYCSQNDELTDMSDIVANQKLGVTKTAASELGINLLGRTETAGMLFVLGGTFAFGEMQVTNQNDNTNNGVFTDPTDIDTINKYDRTFLEAGVLAGKIIKATDSLKITIASGLGVRFTGSELTSTEDLVAATKTYGPNPVVSYLNGGIPVNVAVEGKLNDTWRILGGIRTMALSFNSTGDRNRALTTDKDPASSNYYTTGWLNLDPDITYNIGVTGVIGDLQIDFNMNPAILIFGPNFITGNTVYNQLAMQVAVAYSWK